VSRAAPTGRFVRDGRPLPLREQAAVRDRWLAERLRLLLPTLMDRAGLDAWVVVAREYAEDPVLASLLPASWLSARRRTVLAFRRTPDGVEGRSLTRYPVGAYAPAWDADAGSQHEALRALLGTWDPARIGVDVSETLAHADGLTLTEHRLLVDALGPLAERLVPAEDLVVGWLGTRLPEEVEAAHELNALAHGVIGEAFSRAVVVPGTTTADDLAWWIRQRFHDLGVEPWFQPSVLAQRAGAPLLDERGLPSGGVPVDAPIEPGDLLHCDVGLTSLDLRTDTQRNAYVLRPGEREAPAGLVDSLRVGNRMQDLTTAAMVPGRTGDEVLAAARAAAAAEGVDGDVYSHPVGYHGHGAGPAIGLWDSQSGVPGTGALVVADDTLWALELCVRTPVPEWGGQVVRMALEQGVVLTGGRVEYLDRRQTDLIVL
jgi:Xaa-Pro aminopeptidase